MSKKNLLFPVIKEGKHGFINQNGEVVIAPRFFRVGEFSEGLAFAVSTDGRVGYIDENGNWKVEPRFEFSSGHYNFFSFSQGWAPVFLNSKQYSFVRSDGTQMSQSFDRVFPFSEGRALVIRGTKCGFIDTQGKLVIEPQFEPAMKWMPQASCFSEGLAMVRLSEEKKGLGYIDDSGDVAIVAWFEEAFPFSQGLAQVRRDFFEGYKYINNEGQTAFKTDYRIASAGSFSEDLADVGTDESGLFGYINKCGEWVIEPQFQSTLRFNEGFAPVEIKGAWSYINKSGELITHPRFTFAGHFKNGLAQVREKEIFGYIDTNGDYVWKTS